MPLKRVRPDCLPEVSDEDERVWESQQGGERSAMENLWILTANIAMGWNEQYKLLKMMKSVRTNNVGSPESSVGPPSAAQKLVKNNYNSDGDGGHEGPRFQFSLPKILHLRARAVRVVVMM